MQILAKFTYGVENLAIRIPYSLSRNFEKKVKLRTLESRNLVPFFIFAYWNRENWRDKSPRKTAMQKQQQQPYSLYKNTKVRWFAPQIAGKLVVAGQDKYMNNTNYLIRTKTLNY